MNRRIIAFLTLIIVTSFCMGCGTPEAPTGNLDAYVEEMNIALEIERMESILEELDRPKEEEHERVLRESISEGTEYQEVY